MKTLIQVVRPFEEAEKVFVTGIESMDFSILHIHDIRKILEEHGKVLKDRCKIYEICNAELAKAVFSAEMSMSLVLPCRVSIYEESGKTYIGMIKPTYMMEGITNDHAIRTLVRVLEEEVTAMLERSF